MNEEYSAQMQQLQVIAYIQSPFRTKFGIPRQSGLSDISARIVMEPDFRNPEAFRGIEDYSHLWLIWQFSEALRDNWTPTVRPPRLGGNRRMGVFATRSPFRPNSLGLSSVKLEKVDLHTSDGPVLTVSGADLMNGTPIYDIKPYLSFTDSHPDAIGGFSDCVKDKCLSVRLLPNLEKLLDEDEMRGLVAVLQNDPRPAYQQDPHRIYGFLFGDKEIRFRVEDDRLTVLDISKKS